MSISSKYSFFLAVTLALYPAPVRVETPSQNIEPNLVTQNERYSDSAYGNLERKDWNELYHAHYRCRQFNSCSLSWYKVQSTLGFKGELTKVSSNGNVKHWTWIDRKRQRKKVKATFVGGYLTKLKGIGF